MPARKQRTNVVLDTNVWVRNFKARSMTNPNRQVIRLWLVEKKLQLIVSREIIDEYLGIFAEVLDFDADLVEEWRQRFEEDRRTTVVTPGPRVNGSRDPDDNVFLSAAKAGKAEYLISNDKDLLELPEEVRKSLPFLVVTPHHYLKMASG